MTQPPRHDACLNYRLLGRCHDEQGGEERKEREAEQEVYRRKQDAIDRDLLKRPVRVMPLGKDRGKRSFYFGDFAGERAAVYVGDPVEGTWRSFSDEKKLQAFLEALDPRGKRESALREALMKRESEIRNCLAKDGKTKQKEMILPTRSSSRRSAGEFFSFFLTCIF